jgi:catechol 2,3-dioxygenase-like lactoylglutathione lyase family enzyme
MLNKQTQVVQSANAVGLNYVVYQVTDLLTAQRFLEDFGLTRVLISADRLFMRGVGDEAYLYEARLGDRCAFIGAGFSVASMAELEALSLLPGSRPIEPSDAPGGGQQVRMLAPEGFEITALFGQQASPLDVPGNSRLLNMSGIKPRINSSVRIRRQAGNVLRLGHFVLRVKDHDAMVTWFNERLGLIASDYLVSTPDSRRPLATFLRCDNGQNLVDHHCLFVIGAGETGVHHCSFEVQDFDALASAHDYLEQRGARLVCGIGRHLLGSQIYDYWLDPFGFRVEHYTDGDVVDAEHRPGFHAVTAEETTQWGMPPPPDFFT